MAGFSFGGLITGLDSNNLIAQLVQLERQPIFRIEDRIGLLQIQQGAIRDVRTNLTTLRDRSQDFGLGGIFDQFTAPSTDEDILTTQLIGDTPTQGAFQINVTQLATATTASSSAYLGNAINPSVSLDTSGIGTLVTAGSFTINGQTINVDPSTDSLNDILSAINGSGAGVIATYDGIDDTVTIENATPGDTSLINLGADTDDSNFLTAINVIGATQTTNASTATEVESTRNLGTIDPNSVLNTVNFGGGAITAGSFAVNGVSINVDPTVDTLNAVLARINSADTQVNATYDSATDTIRVVSEALGSRTIGFTSGSSNFLDVTNLTSATQTAGTDSQFTVNGGPVQTRNSNTVGDAIGGVELRFQSVGTSTVTVSNDDDAIIEDVQEFIEAFNTAVATIANTTSQGGDLQFDGSIRVIESQLRNEIFNPISGLSGPFSNLLDIGFSTGAGFNAGEVAQLELDEEAFRSALSDDREAVAELFSNDGDTGIGDTLDTFLESITNTQGFLNQRARAGGSIDDQIDSLNARIERIELRVASFEQRLRLQFTRLEQLVSSFQTNGASLSGLGGGFSGLQ